MYKIFGYDFECRDFEFKTDSFVKAVLIFKNINKSPSVVFISGVSWEVEHRLMYG